MTAPANVKKFYNFKPNSFQKYGAPRDGGARSHRGMDLAHGYGTLVPLLLPGKVTGKLSPASWHGFGFQATVASTFEGRKYIVSYGHGTKASPLKVGSTYAAGTFVIAEGTTGATQGACVHVEVYDVALKKYIDPLILIKKVLASKAAPAATKPVPPTVRFGNRGATVLKLQKTLKKRGHKIKADSIFGNQTRNAVLKVQKKAFPNNKREWDGIAGPKFWKYVGY